MRHKVLLVEKDPYTRDKLNSMYSSEYEIRSVDSYLKIVPECYHFSPAALLFDMGVPGKKDLHMFKETALHCHKKIPIIAAVEENRLEIERFVREQGVFYYIVKPFDFRELSEVINLAVVFGRKIQLEQV